MTTHKTISNLAIAAVILVAAAATSFAQTKSADNSAKRVVAAPSSGVDLALNRAPISVTNFHSSGVDNTTEKSSTPKTRLSPSMFLSSGFNYVNEKSSFTPQVTIYDNVKIDSKPQFSTDGDIQTSSKNRVTFVPSMGQKIPS